MRHRLIDLASLTRMMFLGGADRELLAQSYDTAIRSRLPEARPNGPAVKEYGPLCKIEDCRLADPPRIPDAERRYPGGFPKAKPSEAMVREAMGRALLDQEVQEREYSS